MNTRKMRMAALVLTVGLSGSAQAALHDRGGGLISDDVLNVTWLQDANYANTSGYDADGMMNWADANACATNLSYYDSVRNTSYDDWRLPTLQPLNGITFDYSYNTKLTYVFTFVPTEPICVKVVPLLERSIRNLLSSEALSTQLKGCWRTG